jgi:hypothetical protein
MSGAIWRSAPAAPLSVCVTMKVRKKVEAEGSCWARMETVLPGLLAICGRAAMRPEASVETARGVRFN